MSDPADELLRLEHRRVDAISSGDIETLQVLLAEDLTHTHISGRTDTKESLLESIRAHPRKTTRGDDVRVRLYGDVGVMTGTQTNIMTHPDGQGDPVSFDLHVLQVWVKGADGWKLHAFASSAQAPKELLR